MVMDSYEHSQIGHGKEEEGGSNGRIKHFWNRTPAFPTLHVCKIYFAITILPTTFHIQLTIPDASIQNKFTLFGPVQIFLPLDGADH